MFFNRPDFDLASVAPGSFALALHDEMNEQLRIDYKAMTGMIFGDPPALEGVIESTDTLDKRQGRELRNGARSGARAASCGVPASRVRLFDGRSAGNSEYDLGRVHSSCSGLRLGDWLRFHSAVTDGALVVAGSFVGKVGAKSGGCRASKEAVKVCSSQTAAIVKGFGRHPPICGAVPQADGIRNPSQTATSRGGEAPGNRLTPVRPLFGAEERQFWCAKRTCWSRAGGLPVSSTR